SETATVSDARKGPVVRIAWKSTRAQFLRTTVAYTGARLPLKQSTGMDKQLADVALSQGRWSATANRLKKSFEATRFRVFVVSILAALAAAVSSQQPNGPLRTLLAIVSTTSMAAATFLTARLLDSKHSQAWVRARAASEALKREGYKSAALAEPYNDPNT